MGECRRYHAGVWTAGERTPGGDPPPCPRQQPADASAAGSHTLPSSPPLRPFTSTDEITAAEALSLMNRSRGVHPPRRRRGRPRRTFCSPVDSGSSRPSRQRWKRLVAEPGHQFELIRTELEPDASGDRQCPMPACGKRFGSRQALAAHLRHFGAHRQFYNENVGHRYGNSRVRIRCVETTDVPSNRRDGGEVVQPAESRAAAASTVDKSLPPSNTPVRVSTRVLSNVTNLIPRR